LSADVIALHRASMSVTPSPLGRKTEYSCGKLGIPANNIIRIIRQTN